MSINTNCAICHSEFEVENRHSYIDLLCLDKSDHSLIIRFVKDQMTLLKVKLPDKDKDLYLKISFNKNCLQVWSVEKTYTKSGIIKNNLIQLSKNYNRIDVQETFMPDFSDLEKLKSKIKTIFLFK